MPSEPEGTQAERRILQIIPSAEYCVVYFDMETGEPWVDSVLCWALVEDSGGGKSGAPKTKVLGLVADGGDVVAVDEFPNFVGYMPPTESLDHWRDTSYDAWKEWRESGAEGDQSQPRRQAQARN